MGTGHCQPIHTHPRYIFCQTKKEPPRAGLPWIDTWLILARWPRSSHLLSNATLTYIQITFAFPPLPMLSQPDDIDPSWLCNASTVDFESCTHDMCYCTHQISVKLNQVSYKHVINLYPELSFLHSLSPLSTAQKIVHVICRTPVMWPRACDFLATKWRYYTRASRCPHSPWLHRKRRPKLILFRTFCFGLRTKPDFIYAIGHYQLMIDRWHVRVCWQSLANVDTIRLFT
jgi:hypothetical protein